MTSSEVSLKLITVSDDTKTTKASTVSKYPWSHLFTEEDSKEIIDLSEAVKSKKSVRKLEATVSAKEIEIVKAKEKLDEIKTISTEAFDKMAAQLEKSSTLVKTANLRIQQLEALITPFQSALITQAVIAHSKKLSGKEAHQKVLEGIYRWLQQRKKVVQYLTENKLSFKSVKENLEEALYMDPTEITKQIDEFLL